MYGLSLKSDYTSSIQELQIPQVKKKLLRKGWYKYYLSYRKEFLKSFLKNCRNECLIE